MPFASVNGIKIKYQVVGEGEPLLMIAGSGLDSKSWAFQVLFFRKHYRVITFDNRGVGKSDKPPGPYSTRAMAQDAVELLNYLGISKTNVLGFSMGGMIAQEIAASCPERITKLVLASSLCCRDDQSGQTAEFERLKDLPLPKFARAVIPLFFHGAFFRLVARIQAGVALKKGWALQAQMAATASHNSFDRLNLVKAPTLVIAGTGDRLVRPSSSEVLAAGICHARLVKIANGSHMINMERRKEFNTTVLEFLKEDRAFTLMEQGTPRTT